MTQNSDTEKLVQETFWVNTALYCTSVTKKLSLIAAYASYILCTCMTFYEVLLYLRCNSC